MTITKECAKELCEAVKAIPNELEQICLDLIRAEDAMSYLKDYGKAYDAIITAKTRTELLYRSYPIGLRYLEHILTIKE